MSEVDLDQALEVATAALEAAEQRAAEAKASVELAAAQHIESINHHKELYKPVTFQQLWQASCKGIPLPDRDGEEEALGAIKQWEERLFYARQEKMEADRALLIVRSKYNEAKQSAECGIEKITDAEMRRQFLASELEKRKRRAAGLDLAAHRAVADSYIDQSSAPYTGDPNAFVRSRMRTGRHRGNVPIQTLVNMRAQHRARTAAEAKARQARIDAAGIHFRPKLPSER